MIRFSIGNAGFKNRLVCGTINYFNGWVMNSDSANPIVHVRFSVGEQVLGSIAVRRERPDLAKSLGETMLGFVGVVAIPEGALRQRLRLHAAARDGTLFPMREFALEHLLREEEKDFRKNNQLPDDTLMYLVVNRVDPKSFLEEGKSAVELIRDVCMKNGVAVDQLKDVLDFGVGCGRVIRWWEALGGKVRFYGTDMQPELVQWCEANLDFAQYSVNQLLPPTAYAESQFDLLYAFSVFTHLTLETQDLWLAEFSRVLRPGAHALVSVHGDSHASKLVPDLYREFLSKGSWVVTKNAEGENLCAVYQNKQVTEELFSRHFAVLDYLPEALKACGSQDLFVLQSRKSA
jgi:SAM-dependent methyltransferase